MRRFGFVSLMTVAAYYAAFGGEYSAYDLYRIGRNVEGARASLQELDDATERLADRADELENDPGALETLAREDFGMIRDGEVLYRFADSGDTEEDDAR